MGFLDELKKLFSGAKPSPTAKAPPNAKAPQTAKAPHAGEAGTACTLCSAPNPEYREAIGCYHCSACGYVWRT